MAILSFKVGGGTVAVMRGALFFPVLCTMLLVGCSAPVTSPADIKPVYRIRNSPLPVPDARWNPRRGTGYIASSTAVAARPQETAPIVSGGNGITVRKGDTLYAISRAYGVPVRSLIKENRLTEPYQLIVGQQLKIPGTNTHTVHKGETGYSISRRYGVTVTALMETNNIRPPYQLSVGQVLNLPGGASASTSSVPSAPSVSTQRAAPPKGRVVALPTPPARSASGFIWPVEGRLASRFGPRESGVHNDGINILADEGTPVKAAEAGVVVYASNAMQGYGNLLLLKHADGWITAYAHNERLLVRDGQQVQKGQVVARVGATGGVATPQLHFELRKGSRALDPLNYLSGGKG